MNPISSLYNWQRITPDDGHYFFGYYDRNPWNADQSLHLMLRIDQCERLPLPGEKAEIGVVSPNGGWRKITETRAWCHQQGCMATGSVLAGRTCARASAPFAVWCMRR